MIHCSTNAQSAESMQLECLLRLVELTTPRETAQAIVELAQAHFGCSARVVMWLEDAPESFDAHGCGKPDRELLRRASALMTAADPVAIEGTRIGVRLDQDRAALLLDFAEGTPVPSLEAFAPCVKLAGQHLRRALQLTDLHESHKQLEHSESLQRALFAISDLAGSDRDMPDLLRGIHAIVSTLMYAENFFIVRHDAEHDSLRFLYYADVEDTEGPDTSEDIPMEGLRGTLTWYLIVESKALMGTTEQLAEQVPGPVSPVGPDSSDWLGVPMLRNGKARGALVVQSYREGICFTAEDRALLEFVGSHILTALERKRNQEELEQEVRLRTLELADANRGLQLEVIERQRAERLQAALFHIAQLATVDIDENEFYERLHAVVGELLNAENFFIALLSDDRRILSFPYYVDAGARRTASREVGRGLSEYVLRTGVPLLGNHERIDDLARAGEVDPARIGRPAVCWLGVPLRVDDQVIGVVVVQSYSESVTYGAADQELLSFAALQIANSINRRRSAVSLQRVNAELEQRVAERTHELREQILQRERAQDQLKHQVMHDALTSLPNRGFLRERLDHVLTLLRREPGRRCALLYLDVDRFKVVNDSLGHLAGDEMLKAVASRLLKCVRAPDMVARLSGDEFAVLIEDIGTPEVAQDVARRVLDTLGVPLQIAGRELDPSVSIGIAIGDGNYVVADELLRDADLALYRAKELGRKRYMMFDETLARNVIDVLAMEGELRQALRKGEFEPYFQPFCRLEDGEVVGYEALLRWNHPHNGVMAPAAFLRVAQDSGHIEAIDWRVFEAACGAFRQLQDGAPFLTINVSALHLQHADFDRHLMRLLERTGFDPARLIIEVTEGSLLDDPERVRATLERLRRIGIGAALDDFGTGYSSLSYLHSLPLRMLKIDRSFVHALDEGMPATTTVVAAILALARALGIQVIAEGIETPAQRSALLRMGCEFGQGYLLGRPAPIDQWTGAIVALAAR
jgi:diguanylate cyclase (GGDEF)-like protein